MDLFKFNRLTGLLGVLSNNIAKKRWAKTEREYTFVSYDVWFRNTDRGY